MTIPELQQQLIVLMTDLDKQLATATLSDSVGKYMSGRKAAYAHVVTLISERPSESQSEALTNLIGE